MIARAHDFRAIAFPMATHAALDSSRPTVPTSSKVVVVHKPQPPSSRGRGRHSHDALVLQRPPLEVVGNTRGFGVATGEVAPTGLAGKVRGQALL